jgi:anti-sigma regulatory factor (Ser/Thr protein kinase)
MFNVRSLAFLNTFNRFVTRMTHDRVGLSRTQSLNQSDIGMSLAFTLSDGTEIPIGDGIYGSHPVSLASATKWSFCPFVELRRSFPSKVAAIPRFVDQLVRFALHFRSADGSEIDIEMALREAVANAVIHGNGDGFCKSVYVTCRCYLDGEISITVRDQGRGFHSNTVPDPTLLENLLFTHGRGIYLMKKWTKSLSKKAALLCRCERIPTLMQLHRGDQDDKRLPKLPLGAIRFYISH